MGLLDFVKLKQVQDKFKVEFEPFFENKVKTYRKSQGRDIVPKENVGINIEMVKNKPILICDSFGRARQIDSIEDLIGFLTHSKYKDKLCWFYKDPIKFNQILNHLPEKNLEELEKSGKTQYYAHIIESNKSSFRVGINKKTYHGFHFHNLQSSLKLSVDEAVKNFLNFQQEYSITQDAEKAHLVKRLADHYTKHDSRNCLAFQRIMNIPNTRNYANVGTAFDYLLRFLIKAHNQTAITKSWVAHKSLEILEGKERKQAISILKNAEEQYFQFIKDKKLNDNLIVSALLLTKLDVVLRRGIGLSEIDMNINPADVTDLKNLIQGVPKDLYLNKKTCVLNPTFGLASHLVDGADADLLIDNTLIDIKTTIQTKFTDLYFYQLMGYVTLHYLGLLYANNIKEIIPIGVFDEDDADIFKSEFLNTKIDKIGVYYSRFNYLYTIDLGNIYSKGRMDWNFLEWFENEAHAQFQPVFIKKYFKKTVWRKIKYGKISIDELLYPKIATE